MCLLGVGKGVPRKMPLPIHYNGEMCMSRLVVIPINMILCPCIIPINISVLQSL